MLNDRMQGDRAGEFRIMIGASSKDIRLRDVLSVVE
jgi:hypothetical protein